VSPGFRIIGVSQRLFAREVLRFDSTVQEYENGDIFQYSEGEDATIACYNFALQKGVELKELLENRGLRVALFSVNAVAPERFDPILASVQRSGKLVILDDSQSPNDPSALLARGHSDNVVSRCGWW